MRACRPRQVAIATLAFAGVLVAAPRPAGANKRIAVLAVKGADTDSLDDAVERIVGDCCVVISDAKYLRTAKSVGARTLRPSHVRKVAERIRADGVVRGWLQRDGDRYLFRLRLYEGATGEVVKKLAIRIDDERISSKLSRAIAKRLYAAIEDLRPLRRSRSYDDEDSYYYEERESRRDDDRRRRAEEERREEARRRKAEERRREEERQRRAEREREEERRRQIEEKRRREKERERRAEKKRREREEKERLARLLPADHEDNENPFAEAIPTEKKKKKKKDKQKKKRKKRVASRERDDGDYAEEDSYSSKRDYSFDDDSLAGASLSLGVSAVTRSLEFTSREGLDNPPEGYQGPVVPSLMVGADIYPAALSNKHGAMSKLGLGFNFNKVFGLETAVGGSSGVTLPTSQMSYGVALKVRHRFRKAAYRPTVIASLGFQRLDFHVDKESAPDGVTVDLPNTAYTYFYPGIELYAQFAKKLLASADFKFPLVTSAGEMQEPEQYGAATITGFDVGVGAVYKLSSSIVVNAGVRYLALGFDFKGTGEQAVNRDGDPATEDVAGAMDKYLRGYLTASYAF